MKKIAMFERDILYPTHRTNQPGSVHVTVYPPEESGGIPVVVEAKTYHNPSDYINEILSILQADIFDRILINIRVSGILYFRSIGPNSTSYRIKFIDKDNYNIEEITDIDQVLEK